MQLHTLGSEISFHDWKNYSKGTLAFTREHEKCDSAHIHACLNGNLKTHGGFEFLYPPIDPTFRETLHEIEYKDCLFNVKLSWNQRKYD